MTTIKHSLITMLLGLVLLVVAVGTWITVAMIRPLPLPTPTVQVHIPSGISVRDIAQLLTEAGILAEPYTFRVLVVLAGDARFLQAGDYVLTAPLQLSELINQLKRGKFVAAKLQLTEGKTFAEFRSLVNQLPLIRHQTADWSDTDLMQYLTGESRAPEGWFFPDTYFVDAQSRDVDIYRQAYQQMQKRLQQAWEKRAEHLP